MFCWALPGIEGKRVPNVRSKVVKRTKAMSLVFVLLDLEFARIRRRTKCTGQSENTCSS